jgi:hypothetical protein
MRRATSVVTTRAARSVVALALAAVVSSIAGCQVSSGPAGPSPAASPIELPPWAALAAEGGHAVVGQLGSYTWGESGSDAGWLPGAVIAVGAGEPLTVVLDPSHVVADWSSRAVSADRADPIGARSLGVGVGAPRFDAPGPGRWTVEVRITAVGDIGSASYFWLLEIP